MSVSETHREAAEAALIEAMRNPVMSADQWFRAAEIHALLALLVANSSDSEVERLAREVARERGARWLSIIFSPEDPHRPWSVSIDEGRGGDATTEHGATLADALRTRLAK